MEYHSKRLILRLILLRSTGPGIFELVRALLEQNKPYTSIRLAFLSCSLVLAVEMHFANDVDPYPLDDLLKK